jgi:pyruvate dehydrogenase E1 component alpha subunit
LQPAKLDGIDQEVAQLIDRCVADAKAAALPTEADLLTDVYVAY